jgi:hypothetical protein
MTILPDLQHILMESSWFVIQRDDPKMHNHYSYNWATPPISLNFMAGNR